MTSIIGLLCKDGVVIGADSAVSFGDSQVRTIEQPFDKIDIFGNEIIVVGTGQVGLGQRFCQIVEKLHQDGLLNKDTHFDVGKSLCTAAVEDFGSTHTRPGLYGALVAFPLNNQAHLVEFTVDNFQPEFKTEKLWFSSLGCIQAITDSFLAFLKSVFWSDHLPNISDGIFAVKWTLDHAVKVNPGGVNGPVCLAVLQKTNGKFIARRVPDEELEEHEQNIQDAKNALVEFRNQHKIEVNQDIPIVDRPLDTNQKDQIITMAGVPTPVTEKSNKGNQQSPSQSKKRHRH